MIQEASITGLLNTILIIIIIYYVIKIAARFLGPLLLKYAVNKVEKKVKTQFEQQQQRQHQHTQTNKKVNPSTDDLGEYIDYEEVEE